MKQIIKATGYGLLILIFPIIASVIIQIKGITNDTEIVMIQAVAFFFATLLGIIIVKIKKITLNTKQQFEMRFAKVGYYLPLVFIEVLPFLCRLQQNLSLLYVSILLLFTIFVGISEELFFRVIIFQVLREKGVKFAVVVSSILFSVLHLANLAGGISLEYALLQLIFAGLFGFVAALLFSLGGSIYPLIFWHFAHDFIALITGNEINTLSRIVLIIQCVVLVIYLVYLWKKLPKENNS